MPQPTNLSSCQIVVLGSGLPGSVMALILAKLGYDVVVVDKSRHPRFAIGESSTPIADAYMAQIARRFEIPELAPFSTYEKTRVAYPDLRIGRKIGFAYFQHEMGRPFSPGENHLNEMLVAASPNEHLADSHWHRGDVDSQIASCFKTYNVRLLDLCDVDRIQRVDTGWEFELVQDRKKHLLQSAFFVDATGRSGIGIRSQRGVANTDRLHTRTAAVFAHFEGIQRWSEYLNREYQTDHPFNCDDSALHHLLDKSWVWQLRFHNDLTSCGMVYPVGESGLPPAYIQDSQTAYRWFRNQMDLYPSLAAQFQKATAVQPIEGAYWRGRLQHLYDRGAGRGWCALPGTIGFIDPLHSKGMAHALSGVFRLGTRLQATSSLTSEQLHFDIAALADQFREEILFLDRLINICYQSLGSLDNFSRATYWYFAAATNFEHLCSQSADFDRPFLFSDNEEFKTALFNMEWKMRQLAEQNQDPTQVLHQQTEFVLPHFDRVGLFEPAIRNMYRHTAAPESTKST